MNIKIRDYLLNHLGAFVVGVVGSLLVAYIIGQWNPFPQTTNHKPQTTNHKAIKTIWRQSDFSE